MFVTALSRHDRTVVERATMLDQYLAPGAHEAAVSLLKRSDEFKSYDMKAKSVLCSLTGCINDHF